MSCRWSEYRAAPAPSRRTARFPGSRMHAHRGGRPRCASSPSRSDPRGYSRLMREIAGDSSRNGDWACVRLRIDGDCIVDADADGLDAELTGLTLLEAAAVSGETLAVDALANAL